MRIGLGLVYDGWHQEEWHPDYDDAILLVLGNKLKRKDIKTYLTPEFYQAYNTWQRIREFGLPHGKGWQNECETIMKMTEIFNQALAECQEEERLQLAKERARKNGINR